jgi:hypothetical protein
MNANLQRVEWCVALVETERLRLVGTWRGHGKVLERNIDYDEEITFSHNGKSFLFYQYEFRNVH